MSETLSTNSVGSECSRSPWVGAVGGGDNGLGGREEGDGEGGREGRGRGRKEEMTDSRGF